MNDDTISTAVRVALAIAGAAPETAGADTAPETATAPLRDGLLGVKVLIRTVTMTLTGRVVGIDDELIELEDAAWVADTGRFHVALRDGTLAEVEPFFGRTWVQRSSIVDTTEWVHALPREPK